MGKGFSTRGMLALIGVAVALGLGSWALYAGGYGEPAGEPVTALHGADAAAVAPGFSYADATDDVLFRVDTTQVTQGPSPRPTGVPIRISRHAARRSQRRGTMAIELPDGSRYPTPIKFSCLANRCRKRWPRPTVRAPA